MRGNLSRLHTLLQSFRACATADDRRPELFGPPLRRGNEALLEYKEYLGSLMCRFFRS